ncbi:MAG: glycosyltransferase [Candidatus Eisenbacteria bacterium]|nr:glycosyltransferase [Candidatus Eisenbacteria bacterium]
MLVVLLPAYNEASALPPLLPKIASALDGVEEDSTVLLVDDGSTDGTADVARATADEHGLAIEIVSHGTNRGLGCALRTGFARAAELAGPDGYVVAMDTDDTHDPGLIPLMVDRIDDGYDVVIASRYAPGGREVGLSGTRRFLSRGASLLLTLFSPVRGARDYTCGYRAYSGTILGRARSVWGEDFISEEGFVASAEILLKLGRLGARVAEVPLILRYDLKGGASKMRVGRTIGRYLRLVTVGRRALSSRRGATGAHGAAGR